MLPVTGLVVRMQIQDTVIVDPFPAQVETLDHDTRSRKTRSENFNEIIPCDRVEGGPVDRLGDLSGNSDYKFLVKIQYSAIPPPNPSVSFSSG